MRVLEVRPEAIPAALRDRRQWVVWRFVARPGEAKPTKEPRQAADPSRRASSTDPATWGTFAQALAASRAGRADGIGYVFAAADPFTGVDLDGCRDPATGALEPWAAAIVDRLASYTEVSPSGTGLHVLVTATLPPGGNRKGRLELYDRARYFCMTGDHLPGTPGTIEPRQAELAALHAEFFGSARSSPEPDEPGAADGPSPDDAALLEKMFAAKNGDKLRRLFAGDTSGYPSASEADLAFCASVAFWTRRDPAAIDRLVRQSGLYREKWERADYRERTITAAIAGCCEVYEPGRNGHGDHRADEADPAPAPGTGCTDLANAERFERGPGEDVRFCADTGRWHVWSGAHWRPDALGVVRGLAEQTVRGIYTEAAAAPTKERRQALAAWAKASESRGRLDALLDLAATRRGLALRADAFDRDSWLLNAANGTIDLRTGALRPHDRDDLLARRTAVAFDPAAPCPIWRRFLDEITAGRRELAAFLQRAAGYSATGDTSERVLFLPWGGGANGKSTFLDTVREVLGDYAMVTPIETVLLRDKGAAIPNDLARLAGARFVMASEAPEDGRLDESRVKALTGRDRIPARFMRAEWFEFDPVFKLWVGTNHRPTVRGADRAIWDRLRLLPFVVRFWDPADPEAPAKGPFRDPTLPGRLRAELPGILAWIVEGALLWQRDGLAPPEPVRAATADYRANMDVLGTFLADRCVVEAGAWAASKALRAAYVAWCEANGEKPLSAKALGLRLQERGFESRRTETDRGWAGVRLRTPNDASGA